MITTMFILKVTVIAILVTFGYSLILDLICVLTGFNEIIEKAKNPDSSYLTAEQMMYYVHHPDEIP